MTYDDWKGMSDRDEGQQPDPNRCEKCAHPDTHCDCPCCNGPEPPYEWDGDDPRVPGLRGDR